MTSVNPETGEVLDTDDFPTAVQEWEAAKAEIARATNNVNRLADMRGVEDWTNGKTRIVLKTEWKPSIGEAELARLAQVDPSLVVLVPKVDGKELSLRLKSDKATAQATAILLGLVENTRYTIGKEERKSVTGGK